MNNLHPRLLCAYCKCYLFVKVDISIIECIFLIYFILNMEMMTANLVLISSIGIVSPIVQIYFKAKLGC